MQKTFLCRVTPFPHKTSLYISIASTLLIDCLCFLAKKTELPRLVILPIRTVLSHAKKVLKWSKSSLRNEFLNGGMSRVRFIDVTKVSYQETVATSETGAVHNKTGVHDGRIDLC